MRNLSALPQKVGFVQLRGQLSVQPADGFGTPVLGPAPDLCAPNLCAVAVRVLTALPRVGCRLLPYETLTRDVIFSPAAATEQSFRLVCRTNLNREFVLPCRGRGVEAPLRFSHTLVRFGAVAVGARVTQSVEISNPTSRTQTIHFVVPPRSQLKLSPLVARLAPGGVTRVEIEFTPLEESGSLREPSSPRDKHAFAAARELDEAAGAEEEPPAEVPAVEGAGSESALIATTPRKASEGSTAGATRGVPFSSEEGTVVYSSFEAAADGTAPLEPWSRHAAWKLPCYVRSGEHTDPAKSVDDDAPLLYLEVRTVTVLRELWADHQSLDFGQVAVGHPKVLVLKLKNLGDQSSDLAADALNPVGPFSMVNALRPLGERGGTHVVQVRFVPARNLKYSETLTLRTRTGHVDVTLLGQGVSPVLSVEPASGVLDLGHVLAAEASTATFELRNCSVFPLQYAIRPAEVMAASFNGVDIFSVKPQEATIAAGATQLVTATYAPDHALGGRDHSTRFVIDVPNNSEKTHAMRFSGRCWERQVYVLVSPEDEDASAPAAAAANIIDSHLLPLDQRRAGEAGANAAAHVLAFKAVSVEDSVRKEVKVGCTVCSRGGGGSGSFEVTITGEVAAAFAAEPLKGTVAAGQQQPLCFTFKPPAAGTGGDDDDGVAVGEWCEALATVKLSGGYAPPEANGTEVVQIVLRGRAAYT